MTKKLPTKTVHTLNVIPNTNVHRNPISIEFDTRENLMDAYKTIVEAINDDTDKAISMDTATGRVLFPVKGLIVEAFSGDVVDEARLKMERAQEVVYDDGPIPLTGVSAGVLRGF